MQPSLAVVLALLLARVLADFPLQTQWLVAGKRSGQCRAYASHLAIHLAVLLVALALFTDVEIARPGTALSLALLLTGYSAVDLSKSALLRHRSAWDGPTLFLADELLHMAVLVSAAVTLSEVTLQPAALAASWEAMRPRLLLEAAVLGVTVFPTGYLIRHLMRPLGRALPGGDETAAEQIKDAGLILGWIERALLVFAFAEASIPAIGLIVGAKSIARFPEFKARAFAEYFLIGTLLSVAFAGLGALLLRTARAALLDGGVS